MLREPENIDAAVGIYCYHAYKLRCTLFHMHFRLQADIFDSLLSLTSDSIDISLTMHVV